MARKTYIYSKLNYPIAVKYGKQSIVIPAFAKKFLLEDTTKVGALPPGVRKVDIKEGEK